MTDVLSFLTMAPRSLGLPYARETHNTGAFDVVWPIDLKSGFGKIWRLKSGTGHPWDIQLYDEDYVYDHITELDWNDAKTYKKFVGNCKNSKGVLVDGIPRCPRYIKAGLPTDPLITVNSTFRKFYDCKWDGKQNDVGIVRNQLSGMFPLDHKGDIGVRDTYVITYQWNGRAGQFSDEEVYWYVENYGLARWTHATLNTGTGLYQIDRTSIHNRILPGPPPVPDFPCY